MGWTREQVRRLHELERRHSLVERRRRLVLLKRYDPNQPRVPAGSSEGGRWTDAESGTHVETMIDRTGQRSWEHVITRRNDEGRITRQTVYNHDRSHLTTRYDGDSELSLVTPAGGRLTSFATSGPIQIVRDGLTGSVLSASEFRPGEREPLVQLAQAGGMARSSQALDAAATFWRWRNDRPRDPGEEDVPILLRSMPMSHTGSGALVQSRDATMEEVRRLRPGYDEVQGIVDGVARDISEVYRDAATYGRELHRLVRDEIARRGDPGLKAELTYASGRDAPLNSYGSSRLDVLENPVGSRILCDYDVKTGRDGFSERDMRRHARATLGRDFDHAITIRMRPSVPRILRGQEPW